MSKLYELSISNKYEFSMKSRTWHKVGIFTEDKVQDVIDYILSLENVNEEDYLFNKKELDVNNMILFKDKTLNKNFN